MVLGDNADTIGRLTVRAAGGFHQAPVVTLGDIYVRDASGFRLSAGSTTAGDIWLNSYNEAATIGSTSVESAALTADAIVIQNRRRLDAGAGAVLTSGLINLQGNLNVSNGSLLQPLVADSLLVASEGGLAEFADATVLRVSANSGFQLEVRAGGTVQFDRTTAAFTHLLEGSGQIIVNDSFVNFGQNQRTGGGLVLNSGQITFENSIALGAGPFGYSLDLATGRHLTLGGNDLTVQSLASLALNGGSLTANNLINSGSVQFNRGTLTLTGNTGLTVGSAGPLGSVFTLREGAALAVTNGPLTVASSATFTVDGGTLDTQAAAVTGTLRAFDGLSRVGSGGLTVNSAGRVFATGTLELGGASTNAGRITLQDGTGLITGSTLTNSGLISGDGEIASQVTNLAGGEIRGEAGRTLAFTHGSGLVNQGTLALTNGTIEVDGVLSNTAAGAVISGRGTLIADGGINNTRALNFSSGVTDVYGNVTNTAGGTIITSGGPAAITTFHGDVSHNGAEIRTSAGSSTVFFGTLSGSGAFTGPGNVFIEGGLSIGNSPGVFNFGGNLSLGANTSALWEINDVNGTAGINWDLLQVTGTLTINASVFNPHTINLASLNFANESALAANFNAATDYSFAYATAASGIIGFSADKFVLDTSGFLNPFTGAWSVALDGNSINLIYSAVPEPSTYAAIAGALALFGAIFRRRRNQAR